MATSAVRMLANEDKMLVWQTYHIRVEDSKGDVKDLAETNDIYSQR